MLRFSWNHPRRCVRLRGVVLINEIGNHLTWLARKRSVKVLQLGRVLSEASTKHACAFWCPMVCGILCCCGTTRHSRPPLGPSPTHSPTHSLHWLSVWLAIDCKVLRTPTKPNITLHVIIQIYSCEALDPREQHLFQTFSTFHASNPSSGPELTRQGSIR